MMYRVVAAVLGISLAGLLSGVAQSAPGIEVTVDLAGQSSGQVSHRGEEHGGWSLDAVVEYYAPVPRIVVRGSYVTRQNFHPESHLSYRIFDEAGGVLLAEGRRSDWIPLDDGGMRAEFEIEIPHVLDEPTLSTLHIRFDAVVELQFWYREKYPDTSFPEIRIINIPARDHFEPGWTWVPRFLPAGFDARIPAQFTVSLPRGQDGEFVPALDVNSMDGTERTPSQRVALTKPLGNGFLGWMPLDAHASGTVMVRPGLVWENVRWYEANGWFPRRAVTFVSPILYTLVVAVFMVGLWGVWNRFVKIEHVGLRSLGLIGWGFGAAWFAAQMLMSGFWLVAALFVLVATMARFGKGWDAIRTYVATWSFFVFVELYWAHLESSVGTVTAGIWLSSTVWALLLAPLLAIRRAAIREVVALLITLGWTALTFSSVIYFKFFQDYPSVENLVYAGQVGELGDSVSTLISQAHVLLLVIWAMAVVIAIGTRCQRKTQIENT